MWFYWWDDAVKEANLLGVSTRIRHKVTAAPRLAPEVATGWLVDIADSAVMVVAAELEVCS